MFGAPGLEQAVLPRILSYTQFFTLVPQRNRALCLPSEQHIVRVLKRFRRYALRSGLMKFQQGNSLPECHGKLGHSSGKNTYLRAASIRIRDQRCPYGTKSGINGGK